MQGDEETRGVAVITGGGASMAGSLLMAASMAAGAGRYVIDSDLFSDPLGGIGSASPANGPSPRVHQLTGAVAHSASVKPVSKRRAWRLRGKARA